MVTAICGNSKHWNNYTMHLPTGSGITKHWRIYFPRMTYLVRSPVGVLVLWAEYALALQHLSTMPQSQTQLIPPAILDTGQEFKG